MVPILTDEGVRLVSIDRVDGHVYMDGDVEITEAQLSWSRADKHARGATVLMSHARWTNGIVYYEIDPAMANPGRVTAAMAMWTSQTPFTFVPKTASTPDYIRFSSTASGICLSNAIGKLGGQQTITLVDACTAGNTAHEIGHALGLYHEQSRNDRDNYVSYVPGCLDHSYNDGQFTQYMTNGEDTGPYDYHSIMHYRADAFSNGSCNPLTPIPPYQNAIIGQTFELSEGDVMAAGKLFYGTAQAANFIAADYDHDGFADLSYKDDLGYWRVDHYWNGRQTGNDLILHGFGNAVAHPVPADYDGDGLLDLSVKTDSGAWYIDYSANGFNGWDVSSTGYGNATAIPVPADYDGDCKADLAVKNSSGTWYIDYSSDGIGPWNTWKTGYGDATYIPLPRDYDGDGKADLAVKNSLGEWKIDYAAYNGLTTGGVPIACTTTLPCYGIFEATKTGYGNASSVPVPADYDGDCKADLSVRTTGGTWYVDKASDGFGTWNIAKLYAGVGSITPVPANFDGDVGTATVTCGTPGHYVTRHCGIDDMAWKENDRAGAIFVDDSSIGGFTSSPAYDGMLPLGI